MSTLASVSFALLAAAAGLLYTRTNFISMARFLIEESVWHKMSASDNREARLMEHVLSNAEEGDPLSVLQKMDEYAWNREWFMNIGDVKGVILEQALHNASRTSTGPMRVLELGTYCGYSAVRLASQLPALGKLYTVELLPHHAEIAARVLQHAGVSGKVQVVEGGVQQAAHWFAADQVPGFDLVFLDHDKAHYVEDLVWLKKQGLLRSGALIVADNIKIPGAPEYVEYMASPDGARHFDTVYHSSKLEYAFVPLEDVVAVSVFKGGQEQQQQQQQQQQ